MRAEEHNKYLAYAHFGYGAFQLLMAFVMTAFSFAIFIPLAAGDAGGEFPSSFVAFILVFVFLFQLLFVVPSIVAGFGLLKRKTWAKTAGIIAGALGAMSFPFGIMVCVYTFWFLFGPVGKELYDNRLPGAANRPVSFLREPSDAHAAYERAEREESYATPPRRMPDWR